jgi:hypothetical protein
MILRSRCIFLLILFVQNDRLVAGIVRHRLQPCQKQPSMKMASFDESNTKSGLPGKPERWPNFQPLMPQRTKMERNRRSVDLVPDERLLLIARMRDFRVSVSAISFGRR